MKSFLIMLFMYWFMMLQLHAMEEEIDDTQCRLCLESYEEDNPKSQNHLADQNEQFYHELHDNFCFRCIDVWYKKSKTCPTCRHELILDAQVPQQHHHDHNLHMNNNILNDNNQGNILNDNNQGNILNDNQIEEDPNQVANYVHDEGNDICAYCQEGFNLFDQPYRIMLNGKPTTEAQKMHIKHSHFHPRCIERAFAHQDDPQCPHCRGYLNQYGAFAENEKQLHALDNGQEGDIVLSENTGFAAILCGLLLMGFESVKSVFQFFGKYGKKALNLMKTMFVDYLGPGIKAFLSFISYDFWVSYVWPALKSTVTVFAKGLKASLSFIFIDFWVALGNFCKNYVWPALKITATAFAKGLKAFLSFIFIDFWVALGNFGKNYVWPALKSTATVLAKGLKAFLSFIFYDFWVALGNFGKNYVWPALRFIIYDMWVSLWRATKKSCSWMLNKGKWVWNGTKNVYHYCARNEFGKYKCLRGVQKIEGGRLKIMPRLRARYAFAAAWLTQKNKQKQLWGARAAGYFTGKPYTSDQIQRCKNTINDERQTKKERIIDQRQIEFDAVNDKIQQNIQSINERQNRYVQHYIQEQGIPQNEKNGDLQNNI